MIHMTKRRLVIPAVALGVGVLIVAGATALFNRSSAAPRISELGPLPAGVDVLGTKSFTPRGGSSENRTRTVVVGSNQHDDDELVEAVAQQLSRNGATRTHPQAVILKSGTCVGIDPLSAYLVDARRTDERRVFVASFTEGGAYRAKVVLSMVRC